MKLSIIIPVYNISAYLEECVQSVLNQTFQDYEIILVDDGSKDSSPQICDNLAAIDARIRVIHKENGGLPDARNAGLRVAKGEYIHFLDGDDYYTTDKDLEILVDALYTLGRPDILLFCRKDVYEHKSAMPKRKAANAELKDAEAIRPAVETTYTIHDERPYDAEFINSCESPTEIFSHLLTTQRFNMSACFQLLRREMLVENEIYFTKGLLSEDVDWSLALWQKVQLIKAVNIYAYSYRHRAASISATIKQRMYKSYDYMFAKWLPILQEQRTLLAQMQLGYIAQLYPTLLYNYYLLAMRDRDAAKIILRKYRGVVQYATEKKAQRVQKVMKKLGFAITLHIFAAYGYLTKRILK